MQGSARRGALEAGVCSSWKNHAAVRRRAAAHQRPPGGGGPRPAPFPLPRTRAMRNHRDRLPRTCGGRCSPPGRATAARGKRSPAVALPEGRRCAERRAMACCVCEQSDGGSRGAVGPRAVDSRRQRSMPDRRPCSATSRHQCGAQGTPDAVHDRSRAAGKPPSFYWRRLGGACSLPPSSCPFPLAGGQPGHRTCSRVHMGSSGG